MTIQTKHFIEVSDIVALRLSCNRCDSTLTLPLLDDLQIQLMTACPQCHKSWVEDPNGAALIAGRIKDYVKALRSLGNVLKQRAELASGSSLSLTLEIKQT